MKIRKIEIYGFGKWQQQVFDFADASFIIVAGENESGKTTLRQFILYILFGLSPKKRNVYLPKKGGTLGGKLHVEIDGDLIVIERVHDRNKSQAICYDHNGIPYDESMLKEKLTNMDRGMYNKIFNFDSLDLQQIQHLKADELGEVLLSFGLTGSDRIYWTEKELDQMLQTRFKPQGKKPKINLLLTKIEADAKRLTTLENEQRQYEEKRQEKQVKELDLAKRKKELEQLTEQKFMLTQELQLYPTIEKWKVIMLKLAALPPKVKFPADGIERYEEVRKEIYPIKSQLHALEHSIQYNEQKIADWKQEQWELDTVRTFEQLMNDSESYYADQNKREMLEESKNELAKEMEYELQGLHLDCTTEDILKLPLSFATEEIWQSLKEEQKERTEEYESVKIQVKKYTQKVEQLTTSMANVTSQRLNRNTFAHYQTEMDQLQDIQRQSQTKQADQEQQEIWKNKRSKQKRRMFFLTLFMTFLTTSSLLFGYFMDEYWYFVSVTGFLIALALPIHFRQSSKTVELFFKKNAKQLSDSQMTRLHELEEILDKEYQRMEQLNKIRKEKEQMQQEQVKLTERISFIEQQMVSLDRRIREQQQQFMILQDIPLTHWPKLYQKLEKIRKDIARLDQLNQEMDQLNNKIVHYETIVTEQYEQYIDKPYQTFTNVLGEVRQQIIFQQNLREQMEQLSSTLDKERQKKERLQATVKPYQQTIEQLWETAGVTDEESFFAKGNLYQEWSRLKDEKSIYQQQLEKNLSDSMFMNILEGENRSKELLEQQLEEISENINVVNKEIEKEQQKIANLHAGMEQLEQSTTLNDAKHEYYRLKNKLQEEAKSWAIQQLAITKLKQTKVNFQGRYLPRILEEASSYFSRITAQRYQQIFFSEQEKILQTIASDGSYYSIAELSQGTKDQLYISIRIALSEMLVKQTKFPFFIDDGFVHFDRKRAEVVIDMFYQLVIQHQQMFYFCTDEKQVEYLFKDKNIQLIKLSEDRFTS